MAKCGALCRGNPVSDGTAVNRRRCSERTHAIHELMHASVGLWSVGLKSAVNLLGERTLEYVRCYSPRRQEVP